MTTDSQSRLLLSVTVCHSTSSLHLNCQPLEERPTKFRLRLWLQHRNCV